MIAVGSFSRGSNGHFPGDFRYAILGEVSRRVARVRQFGSTGVDLAYTASGALGGAVVFGHHAWDNAAGAALVLAAGGRVTDLAGDGDHYAAHVISTAFSGKTRVAQHKLVFDALGGRMGGELHALQLTTAVPQE